MTLIIGSYKKSPLATQPTCKTGEETPRKNKNKTTLKTQTRHVLISTGLPSIWLASTWTKYQWRADCIFHFFHLFLLPLKFPHADLSGFCPRCPLGCQSGLSLEEEQAEEKKTRKLLDSNGSICFIHLPNTSKYEVISRH